MANVIRLKRASGSDPVASDLVSGEPAVRTDTGELFFKKDDGSVAKVSGAGGGPDFKYLALRNAANNGAASYPNADFTLVTSGTTNALTPTAANTLLVSVNGVIQKPNTGTSTPSSGFALSGSTIKFGANLSAAPDFILYQESGGIGEPSDETVSEAKLKVSNNPVNGYFLSAQSGNTGGLTWAAPVATSCTGNSATATALATARTINGTSFDGTANITVTAAAGTLTGTTLNSSVVTSSLTSLGDLAGLTVDGDATFTGANYNVLWDKSDNALEFADQAKATFGTGSDLQIYHSSNVNFIDAAQEIRIRAPFVALQPAGGGAQMALGTAGGSFAIFHNGNEKLATVSNGVSITGNALLSDSTGANSGKLQFGASQDLEIYHSSDTNIIDSTGKNLQIKHGSDSAINSLANGAVELFHDNIKRFETTSTGISVAGVGLFTGNLAINDNAHVYVGNSGDLDLFHNTQDCFIRCITGVLKIQTGTENAITATKNAQVELYYDNSKKAETVTGGFTITGVCTATSFAGDGSNLTGVGGATGGGSDEVFYENSTTVTTSYSITSNKNAMSAGPISINNSVTVTVPSGSVWTIV